jgi:hypothetical protein
MSQTGGFKKERHLYRSTMNQRSQNSVGADKHSAEKNSTYNPTSNKQLLLIQDEISPILQ